MYTMWTHAEEIVREESVAFINIRLFVYVRIIWVYGSIRIVMKNCWINCKIQSNQVFKKKTGLDECARRSRYTRRYRRRRAACLRWPTSGGKRRTTGECRHADVKAILYIEILLASRENNEKKLTLWWISSYY